MSKHFAFIAFPGLGHLNPVLAVARELIARGHRVTVPTVPQLTALVEAAGAAAPVIESPMLTAHMAGDGLAAEGVTFDTTLQVFIAEARGTADQYLRIFDGDRPDVLLQDHIGWAGTLLADRWDLPLLRVYPSLAHNEKFSIWRAALAGNPASAATEQALADLYAAYGQPAPSLLEFLDRQPDRAVCFFPRAFQPAGDSFDDRYTFTGPALPETGTEQRKPEQPVLLVSLGSAFNVRPDFYRIAMDAFAGTPWQVELATGMAVDHGSLGPIPANVRLHGHAPQLEILQRATAFVSHGGMGSVQESLLAGVPLVCVPQMIEQEINSDRVAELGLGEKLTMAELTPELLAAAVDRVAGDPGVAARIAVIRAESRVGGGAAAAADAVERMIAT
ncbi:glycosyl transferase [Pseudonocardiaceae bacterium YIM PH 21723]|nr:glycosyl transferase [Pseudonocardiaceae bacterium YIM PH 21723]